MHLRSNKSAFARYIEAVDYEDKALHLCSPAGSLPAMFVFIAIVLVCRYVPFLQAATGLRDAFVPVALVIIAEMFTHLAWRAYPREDLCGVFLFFDTTLYGAAILSWAVLSSPPASYIISGLWLVSLIYWAMLDSITWIGVGSVLLGPAVTLMVGQADANSLILLVFGATFYSFIAHTTRSRKEQERRIARAEDVIKKVDNLLEDHREDVFGKRRVHLAALFHGLKNEFALASWNLSFLQENVVFEGENEEVLRDAQTSMLKISDAVESTLENLRGKAEEENVFRVQSIASALEDENVSRKGTIVCDIVPDVWVFGSIDYAMIVLDNLIGNALDAGASEVRISCALTSDKTVVSLTIQDNGPGLPRSVRARLFDPFNTAGKKDGTGLGIYLSGRMVESMGGEISLRHTSGEGTEFEINLPIASEKAATSDGPENPEIVSGGQKPKDRAN